MSTLLALISHRQPEPETVDSLVNVFKRDPDISYTRVSSSIISKSRNDAAKAALDQGVETLFMVDDDIVFGYHHLQQLNSALNMTGALTSSVAAITRTKSEHKEYNVGWLRTDKSDWLKNYQVVKKAEKLMGRSKVETADKIGTGLIAIKTSVFESIPEPWFKMDEELKVQDEEGNTLSTVFVGEDTYFTLLQKKHGVVPLMHFGCRVGHVGRKEY
jgi:hypothetical protein